MLIRLIQSTFVVLLGLFFVSPQQAEARFLQTDPVGYGDQMNMYAYVANDPINNTDPSGEVCIPCITGAIGAGVELGSQLLTQEGRAAYGNAIGALAKGDFAGAVDAAGSNLAKVGAAAAIGAVGGQAASTLTRAATSARAAVGAEVGVGAATGGIQGATNAAIDGKSGGGILSAGATGAAGGALGATVGKVLGNVAGNQAAQGVLQRSNAQTEGAQALARGMARQAGQRAQVSTGTFVGASVTSAASDNDTVCENESCN